MTSPMVLAKRTGLCGVLPSSTFKFNAHRQLATYYLPGSKNISPSLIGMSLNFPSSTTRKSMSPLYW